MMCSSCFISVYTETLYIFSYLATLTNNRTEWMVPNIGNSLAWSVCFCFRSLSTSCKILSFSLNDRDVSFCDMVVMNRTGKLHASV